MNGEDERTKGKNDSDIPLSPPNCLMCRHFKVTWEPAYPRACMLFGVKCTALPSAEIFLSTGKHCFAFEAKVKK